MLKVTVHHFCLESFPKEPNVNICSSVCFCYEPLGFTKTMPIPTIIEAFFICNFNCLVMSLIYLDDLKRKLKSEKRASFLINLNSQQTLKK